MDLAALRTFCRAVETGSLTRAAHSLHVTKSVASRRLSALENELGARLVQRTTRGITPTDEGVRFYERCQTILDDLDDAAQMLRPHSGGLAGRLRLTAPRAFGDLHLTAPLGAFMTAHPHITLECRLTDERVDITGGGYDLGLRIVAQPDDSSLSARALGDISYAAVASPAYLARFGTPETPADLAAHRCIFYANMAASQQWQFRTGAGLEKVRVSGPLTTNSGIFQRNACLDGLGIAVLPRFFVADGLASGALTEILQDTPRPPATLYALYPEKRLLSAKVRALIDHLAAWFQDPAHRRNL
ncbi:LysR family transcriptional regulator [Yunchengibacter salinarum]|uniref:LysR family transcriptional regulator n=1 Tax=Yunchengibacter salinarum TaxID=3133399 RepID=UPI0035B67F69